MGMRRIARIALGALLVGGALVSCAYRLVAGPLTPLAEQVQGEGSEVADDGTVTFHIDRLKISLRPMIDEELNRQFATMSDKGNRSTNPYTFGNWIPEGEEQTPGKFTIFRLKVENYAFPKVIVNPLSIVMDTQNGRTYEPYSFELLREHYYPYNLAYSGEANTRFRNRTDLLKRTMYPVDEQIFAGQGYEGFVVFPRLHDDVLQIEVEVNDVALRFDYRNEPTETVDLVYHFERKVWREE